MTYEAILEEDEPLFELKFPRFSYRYKYTNGQYSVFAPFSLPAFIPGDFEYDAKKAYNLGMENTLRSLKLQGWGSEENIGIGNNHWTIVQLWIEPASPALWLFRPREHATYLFRKRDGGDIGATYPRPHPRVPFKLAGIP